jgi:hypothetical protein
MKTVLRALLRGKYTLLAVVAALTLTSASVALAGSGVNGVFNLGVTNTVNAITTLVSGAAGVGPAGPMLRIDNNSTNAAATALELLVEPGKAPMKVNSGTKVTNLNADRVDGKDSTALGVTIKTAHSSTGACTTAGTYSACAPVSVKVPAGKQYHVTVSSSFAAESASAGNVRYCPAIQGGSFAALGCIAEGSGQTGIADSISLAPNYAESAAISGELGPIPAGTYTFSTTINPDFELIENANWKAHTTVMVRDVSAPGPPIN